MKSSLVLVSLSALTMLIGCASNSSQSSNGGGGQQHVLQSIEVSSSSASVAAGLSLQLSATGMYSDGASTDLTASVTWTSSDTSIATVASSGLLTGKSAGGPITITATSGSLKGTTTVSITAALVKSISAVNPSSATIAAFTQQQFRASAILTDGTTADITHLVTWRVSPTTIASISNNAPTQGLVTAGDPASTSFVTVTATCSLPACAAQTGTPASSVTLKITNATPTSIAIAPSTPQTIGWGTQLQFTAIGTFSDGTTQDITNVCSPSACVNWVSSQSNVFITASSGLAIGKSVGGPANITVTFLGVTSAAVPVSVDLSNLISIAVTPNNPVIANGTNTSFSAIGTFVDGSTRNLARTGALTWNSSVSSVASISSGGFATSAGPGTTTITASAAGINGSTILDVESATLQSFAIAPTSAAIALGTNVNFTAVGTFVNCSSCPFQQVLTSQPTTTWSSSNTSAATINSAGIATGNSAGTTTITASSSLPPSNISASVPLTVSSASLVAIAVTPANTFVPPGASVLYTAIGSFSDNSTQALTGQASWSTSDASVASSSGPVVTAQGRGTVTVSAQLGSVVGTTSLLVTSSALASIAITPANARVAEKTTAQLKAIGTFQDGTVQDLTTSVHWQSTNGTIATIGASSGILSALTPGSTAVSATFGSITGTSAVTVTNATLTSITVSPSSATLNPGGAVRFSANGHFSDGSTQNLSNASWSSSNPNVAIITSSGWATSSGIGTTTISATLNGVTGHAILSVQ